MPQTAPMPQAAAGAPAVRIYCPQLQFSRRGPSLLTVKPAPFIRYRMSAIVCSEGMRST